MNLPLPSPTQMGLIALLGLSGSGSGHSCNYSMQQFYSYQGPTAPASVSSNVVIDPGTGGIVTSGGDSRLNRALEGGGPVGVVSSPSVPCPSHFIESGITTHWEYTLLSSSPFAGSETGIYEWNFVVTTTGIVLSLCMLIFSGLRWAQRCINVMTEETSEDDNIVWHEREDGKPYYTFKRRNWQDWSN